MSQESSDNKDKLNNNIEKNSASKKYPGMDEIPSATGVLRWIEIVGNKLPHPFWMFLWISVIIVITSAITSYFNVSATQPGTGAEIAARNIATGSGSYPIPVICHSRLFLWQSSRYDQTEG